MRTGSDQTWFSFCLKVNFGFGEAYSMKTHVAKTINSNFAKYQKWSSDPSRTLFFHYHNWWVIVAGKHFNLYCTKCSIRLISISAYIYTPYMLQKQNYYRCVLKRATDTCKYWISIYLLIDTLWFVFICTCSTQESVQSRLCSTRTRTPFSCNSHFHLPHNNS